MAIMAIIGRAGRAMHRMWRLFNQSINDAYMAADAGHGIR